MKKVTSRKGKSKIKNKKIGRDNVPKKGKKKKERKKNWQRQRAQERKRKNFGRGTVPRQGKEKKKRKKSASTHEYFCPLNSLIFFLQFSLHFGRKLFSGLGEKTSRLHHLFFLMSWHRIRYVVVTVSERSGWGFTAQPDLPLWQW